MTLCIIFYGMISLPIQSLVPIDRSYIILPYNTRTTYLLATRNRHTLDKTENRFIPTLIHPSVHHSYIHPSITQLIKMADEYSYTKIIADSVKSQLPNSSHSHDYSHSSIHSRACFVPPSQTTTHYKYGFGHEYECGDRSRLLVVLRWCSGILDKIVSAYLANPFLMIFLPLLIGMVLGGILVCYVFDAKTNANARPQGNTIIRSTRPSFFIMTILASLHRCYEFLQWLGCFFGVLGSPWNEQKVRMDPNPEDAVEIHPSDSDQKGSNNSDSHSQNDRNDSNAHNNNNIENCGSEIEDEDQRDIHTRKYLQSDVHTTRESGLEASQVPKHIA
jgi:hypothetical protein